MAVTILSELCDVHLDNKGDPFSQLEPATTGDTKMAREEYSGLLCLPLACQVATQPL